MGVAFSNSSCLPSSFFLPSSSISLFSSTSQPTFPYKEDELDSLQYHFFFQNIFIAIRLYHTTSLNHASVWMKYDDNDEEGDERNKNNANSIIHCIDFSKPLNIVPSFFSPNKSLESSESFSTSSFSVHSSSDYLSYIASCNPIENVDVYTTNPVYHLCSPTGRNDNVIIIQEKSSSSSSSSSLSLHDKQNENVCATINIKLSPENNNQFICFSLGEKVYHVSFLDGPSFEWKPGGQDLPVIHRPSMPAVLNIYKKNILSFLSFPIPYFSSNGVGYSKRFYGDYPYHWGYRFVHCAALSSSDILNKMTKENNENEFKKIGKALSEYRCTASPALPNDDYGKKMKMIWTADAQFGFDKYDYFKCVTDKTWKIISPISSSSNKNEENNEYICSIQGAKGIQFFQSEKSNSWHQDKSVFLIYPENGEENVEEREAKGAKNGNSSKIYKKAEIRLVKIFAQWEKLFSAPDGMNMSYVQRLCKVDIYDDGQYIGSGLALNEYSFGNLK